MKILELRSENFKRLRAVRIRPDGDVVQITGKNGAGKSSALDSIYAALAGRSACPAVPIRKGEEQSTIRLELGERTVELIVTRTFRLTKDGDDYTTTLVVESADGARFPSPQNLLDSLLGELSFDPLAFARAAPKDQLEMLKRLVPGVDFDAIERANLSDYERRRDLNRKAKDLRAQLEALRVPDGAPEARVDEAELVQKLEQAGAHNTEIEKRRANRERVENEASRLDREAGDADQRAAELTRQAEAAAKQAAEHRAGAEALRSKLAAAGPLPESIDTAPIKTAIAAARDTNRLVDERARIETDRKRLESEAKAAEQASEALTRAMDERNEQKAATIAAAEIPVPGLAFGDGSVTLAGLPFNQASDAEQLRASVAIAAALNPKLKVIRVRDGSLLDTDGLKLLAEMAEKHGAQVWLERVADDGRTGFVIEDGALVVSADGANAAA